MNMQSHRPNGHVSIGSKTQIVGLVGTTLLIALFMIARYGGSWGETDTANFTQAMQAIVAESNLVPRSAAYSNGYGYPALGVWLARISSINLPSLQLYLTILLAPWVVLPGWLLYRELTVSSRTATLATIILLVQPEFIFPLLRGTHEKFTRGLMLICLFILVRSLRNNSKLHRLVGFMVAFYLCAFALITFNNLLATSFIAALALTVLLSWLVIRRTGPGSVEESAIQPRLIYVINSLLVIAFIFTFYAYPPAQDQINVLHTITERLVALLLQMEQVASNPYTVVTAGWVSLPVYFALSLANWLLLVISLAIWLSQASSVVRRRAFNSQNDLFLWAFFGAFALQGLLSIAVDFSGAVATNLQHRFFPSFAMIAAPLTAKWLVTWKPKSISLRKWLQIGFALGIPLLMVLATLKATSEPLLSNKWLFHLPGERQAILWADKALTKRWVWTGFDERINTALLIRNGTGTQEVHLDQYDLEPGTRDLLISTVTRLRGLRLGEPLPFSADDFITYDNGQAQIYHLRPRTQFQR
jgi:hypothetical protein